MNIKTASTIYRKKIIELYSGSDEKLIRRIEAVVEPFSGRIATSFYEVMMNDESANKFLDTDLVNSRLHASMSAWVCDLFKFRKTDEVDAFIDKQMIIGDVHERIDMPMIIFDQGMLTIKEELNNILRDSSMNRDEVSDALIFVTRLLDYVTVIINERFIDNSMDHSRRSEMLKAQSINANLAYECALLRTALFNWFCDALILLFKSDLISPDEIDIWNSNIGLWVSHKAKSIFSSNQEISKLDMKLQQIEADIEDVLAHHAGENNKNILSGIESMRKHIVETDWIIESLEKTALEHERGRDILTNLFNRRYLPNILKSEMKFNHLKGSQFAILYVDIDKFKEINDNYGHSYGDYVLNEISYLLLHSVRVGDYVFRYGGDEFLIVLTETSEITALQVAEKLRALAESHTFRQENGSHIEVTLSIGVAMSKGEKDYEKIITKADEALNDAKGTGRNRCVFS